MSVDAGVLVDIEQDAETAARDITQFCTVEHDVAISALENWCKVTFGLAAGHVFEVAAEGSDEPSFLFVNRNVKHKYQLSIFQLLQAPLVGS